MMTWLESNLWTRSMRDHINEQARKASREARKAEQQAEAQRQAALPPVTATLISYGAT